MLIDLPSAINNDRYGCPQRRSGACNTPPGSTDMGEIHLAAFVLLSCLSVFIYRARTSPLQRSWRPTRLTESDVELDDHQGESDELCL